MQKFDGEIAAWLAERAWLGALVIASIAGVLLIVGTANASATRAHHATHAPKTLAAARSSERHAGHHTPSVKPARSPKITHAHRLHHR